MSLTYYIFLVVLILAVNLIIAKRYKGKEKKGKGFAFNYYKLSYRRKFIRTLWIAPFATIIILALYWYGTLPVSKIIIILVILFILLLVQLAYNYIKWKKEEGQK
ncbi:hypothetical protein [Alkalihalobacillus sp. R86527]|uniref:hypothetical protein n=1 Tax=Alkalihalobacillus sp. R86527 TaxID=3093863 RepID=UPI0036725EEB